MIAPLHSGSEPFPRLPLPMDPERRPETARGEFALPMLTGVLRVRRL